MSKLTAKSVFTPRAAFKPFEYPEVMDYKKAINQSHWWVTEFGNFGPDAHDFKVNLTPPERNLIKNAMLAISQIEVAVKMFWARIGDRFPKPEFYQVGITFADSEIRHADAYSHLLTVMGLEEEFVKMMKKGLPLDRRSSYLCDILRSCPIVSDEDFVHTLAMFSLFIENVSLFSQFLIIKSFNRHSNLLKDIENVVQATQKEEQVHALFGAYMVRLVRAERPEWFGNRFAERLAYSAASAFAAESDLVDWMFEQGDVPSITRQGTMDFIRARFDLSIDMMGTKPLNDVVKHHNSLREDMRWFSDEIPADTNTDFFFKQPVGYTKAAVAFRSEELF